MAKRGRGTPDAFPDFEGDEYDVSEEQEEKNWEEFRKARRQDQHRLAAEAQEAWAKAKAYYHMCQDLRTQAAIADRAAQDADRNRGHFARLAAELEAGARRAAQAAGSPAPAEAPAEAPADKPTEAALTKASRVAMAKAKANPRFSEFWVTSKKSDTR